MNFREIVEKYAQENNWTLEEIDDDGAYLEFVGESGKPQALEILKGEKENLIFVAPMSAGYESEEEIPHEFSTLLLQRNGQVEIGYWLLEDLDGELTYCCAHEAFVADLTAQRFGEIAAAVVKECDEVESMLEEEEDNTES